MLNFHSKAVCANDLPRIAAPTEWRPGVEAPTCSSQVQHPNHRTGLKIECYCTAYSKHFCNSFFYI